MAKASHKGYAHRMKAGETRHEYKVRMHQAQSRTPTQPKSKMLVGVGHDSNTGKYQKEVAVVNNHPKNAGWRTLGA